METMFYVVAGLVGAGAITSAVGHFGGNNLINKAGKSINNFGKNMIISNPDSKMMTNIGNTISRFGLSVSIRKWFSWIER